MMTEFVRKVGEKVKIMYEMTKAINISTTSVVSLSYPNMIPNLLFYTRVMTLAIPDKYMKLNANAIPRLKNLHILSKSI